MQSYRSVGLFAFVLFTATLLNPASSRASSTGPPNYRTWCAIQGGANACGPFSCQTCVDGCHSSFPLNSGQGGVDVQGLPASYTPDAQYNLTVVLRDPNMLIGGFELSVHETFTAQYCRSGFVEAAAPNTRVDMDQTGNGQRWLKHSQPQAAAAGATMWDFLWTAPSPGEGDVLFNVCANAANANGSNSGDRIYCVELRVPEGASEICDNGQDDDGDTLIDCVDPDCDAQPCDDGDFCTNPDTCVGNICLGEPDQSVCDDGEFCNGIERCDPAAGCGPGTPRCTDAGETCDEVNDTCVEVDCGDGVDNDGDGAQDCADSDCFGDPNCPEDCTNGTDDDGDTLIDCEDVDDCPIAAPCMDDGLFCTGQEVCDGVDSCVSLGDPCPVGQTCNENTDQCDPPGTELCDNGVDDDGNGLIDCEDVAACPIGTPCVDDGLFCTGPELCDGVDSCLSAGDPCQPGETCDETNDECDPAGTEVCDNGADDDGDTLADCADTADCPVDTPCQDDGMFCTGAELCDGIDSCVSQGDPCQPGETCDEANDECDPAGSEICDNAADDDGDGDVDCDDADCFCDLATCPAADCDGDLVSNDTDCDPDNGNLWAAPIEVPGIDFVKIDQSTDFYLVIWSNLDQFAGTDTVYDVITGLATDFVNGGEPFELAVCGVNDYVPIPFPQPPGEICNNAVDDDGDQFVDCVDPDCAGDANCPETGNCIDLVDNDSDGFLDCDDPDCFFDRTCLPVLLPTTLPPNGNGFVQWFLVRAQSVCGTGSYGNSSETPDPRDYADAGGPPSSCP